MKKDNLTTVDYGRRNLLSLSALAGTILLLEEKGNAAVSNDNSDLSKNINLADTLALYANFLDEVRRVVLQADVIEVQDVKMTASVIWGRMIDLAERYEKDDSVENANFLASEALEFKNEKKRFDEMRNKKLTDIKELDRKIDDIRADILDAGKLIDSSEKSSNDNDKLNMIKASQSKIDIAITKLRTFNRSSSDLPLETKNALNSEIMTPDNFILLLTSVKQAMSKTAKSTKDKKVSYVKSSYERTVSSNSNLALGIKDVLRRYIEPPRDLQNAIGMAAIWWILLTNEDKTTRLKLLKDPLRLIGGLLPEKRISCARELADLVI